MQQAAAVSARDCLAQLSRITAPTQITFGRREAVTSTRFAEPLKNGIKNADLVIFDDCAHTALYEKVEEFNQRTLTFLKAHSGHELAATRI